VARVSEKDLDLWIQLCRQKKLGENPRKQNEKGASEK